MPIMKVLMLTSMSCILADNNDGSMPTRAAFWMSALAETNLGEAASKAGILAKMLGFMIAKPKSTLSTAKPTAPALM